MTGQKNPTMLFLAFALALGLAACGGSGSRSATEPTATEPTADELRAEAIDEAKDELAAARDALAAAMSSGATTDAELASAYQAVATAADHLVMALKANGGTADDLEAAVEARENAESEVIRLAGVIADADAAAEQAAREAASVESMRIAQALLAHSTSADDIPADSEFNFTAAGTGAEITREGGEADITLNQDPAAKKAKPYAATASPIDRDWAGMTYTYTDPEDRRPAERAVVFTNIDKAGAAPYTAFFDGTDGRPDNPDATTGSVSLTATIASRISSGILPSAPSGDDDSTTRKHAAGARIAGTFHGVSGTYACGATGDDTCEVTLDGEGNVAFGGTVLTFAPTIPSGEALADIKVPYAAADADFLHFGYWMESTNKRDGTRSHVVRTFSGSEAAAYDGIGDVTGTAFYAGAAAGRYVKKTLDPDGTASEVSDGSFTADANLTATFGNTDGTVAAADQFSIKGEIANFMDGGTDLGWTLELGKANLGDRDTATGTIAAGNATNRFSGLTTGSAGARLGTWSGTLYGVDPEETGDAPVVHQPPTGVAGEFNGHFTNGHVAGAFGASIDD